MTRSPGQVEAIEQLKLIAASGTALEILSTMEPDSTGTSMVVELSISFAGIERTSAEFRLNSRERFWVVVPSKFPFDHPVVRVPHSRWAIIPHVQWRNQLCIFQAPQTEWIPSDGMAGLVDRLVNWVERAAQDSLDEIGAANHPPIAYPINFDLPMIVAESDTPPVPEGGWQGYALLKDKGSARTDLVGWSESRVENQPLGSAFLLSDPMPFEFPSTVSGLLGALLERGVEKNRLIVNLIVAAASGADGDPLLVCIGTPMRGIVGSGQMLQHLAVWYVKPTYADALRVSLVQISDKPELQEIGRRAEAIFFEWAKTAECEWLRLHEDRPEIVTRRDVGSSMESFRDKAIAVWGCGAIGGYVSEALVRAGASTIWLFDNSYVTPGILVRQVYTDSDVGRLKVEALRDRLAQINPSVEIQTRSINILDALDDFSWSEKFDLVIDATASERIARKLEHSWADIRSGAPRIASMSVGHNATRAMMTVVGSGSSGGVVDATRQAKIQLNNRPGLQSVVDDFWPGQRTHIFQPEPGCSEPTFTGSYARLSNLSGTLLEELGRQLADGDSFAATVIYPEPGQNTGGLKAIRLPLATSRSMPLGTDGYELRIEKTAWRSIASWIAAAKRIHGAEVETGGHLYGERDEASRVIWISEVSGPPPDSTHSKSGFVCGTMGSREISEDLDKVSRGSTRFIGQWHTHPNSKAEPSGTDRDSMLKIVTNERVQAPVNLLLILGEDLHENPTVGAFLYKRDEDNFFAAGSKIFSSSSRTQLATSKRKIGLAMSGGGSRAIAFHLGCLRALHDSGILSKVRVISAVSGGSVIAAAWAYSDESFEEFDSRIQKLLRRGLARPFVRRLLLSKRVLEIPTSVAMSASTSLILMITKRPISFLANVFGKRNHRLTKRLLSARSSRHWRSRIDVFEDVLKDTLYNNIQLQDTRRDDLDIVINTTEMITGTAFRFGSKESSWRTRKLANNNIPVSHAVAASAAYPTFLPAVDDLLQVNNRDGDTETRRVLLADGGIFDNLGTSCLEPDRSHKYSYNVFEVSQIISCDAGRGMANIESAPTWGVGRIKRAIDVLFGKSQDYIRGRLFEKSSNGVISDLLVSYLGQADKSMPVHIPALVPRENVINYPTNFSSMSQANIDMIALRGEQLTRQLISRYGTNL